MIFDHVWGAREQDLYDSGALTILGRSPHWTSGARRQPTVDYRLHGLWGPPATPTEEEASAVTAHTRDLFYAEEALARAELDFDLKGGSYGLVRDRRIELEIIRASIGVK